MCIRSDGPSLTGGVLGVEVTCLLRGSGTPEGPHVNCTPSAPKSVTEQTGPLLTLPNSPIRLMSRDSLNSRGAVEEVAVEPSRRAAGSPHVGLWGLRPVTKRSIPPDTQTQKSLLRAAGRWQGQPTTWFLL